MTHTPIPTKGKEEGFRGFITLLNNRRIFFSAPFGMGKTYFLKEFFKAKKDHYTVFHLYPVKYQIHNDAEVTELIGADLLIKLLEKDSKSIKNLLNNKETLRKFKYAARSVSNLIGSFVGVDVLNVIDTITKLSKNEKMKEVEDAIANIKNNFFEDLVSEVLKKTKESTKKEHVLIIDDLDRLEPKHIFKILNAFSPLQDEEENKFGFDRVIFVGDIDNLKKIFHHLYGKETDFEGYIDKFFSVAPYQYDIKEELRSVIKQIIAGYAHDKEHPLRESIEGEGGHIASVLFFILTLALQVKKINLRNIFMPQNIPFPDINTDMQGRRGSKNAQVNISARMLLWLFQNDKGKLLNIIEIAQREVTEGKAFQWSRQDILNLQDSGESMLREIFAVTRNQPQPYSFRDEEEQRHGKKEERERMRQYHESFEYARQGGDLKRAIQEFLKTLHEYIERDVYNDDHNTKKIVAVDFNL